jgi:hypothetical protein
MVLFTKDSKVMVSEMDTGSLFMQTEVFMKEIG